MKFTKIQIISALIGIGAFLDTVVAFVTSNESLLTEFGVSSKWASIIKLIGLLITLFSTSLLRKKAPETFSEENDEIIGTRPNDR